MQQRDDDLAQFDRLNAKRRKSGAPPVDDALTEFDRLMGAKPPAAPQSGPIALPSGKGRPDVSAAPAATPDAGRKPGWWASNFGSEKKAAPSRTFRGGYDRFGEGSPLLESDETDDRKQKDVRRRTGDLKPVVIEADPERVTVSRAERVKRDWAPAVKAETEAGFERQAAGQPTDLNRPKTGKQNFNAAALRVEAQAARDRAERLRMTGRLEDKNMADDLEARAYNTELLVDRTEQTDTFGAIAKRNATFGLSDAHETRQITDIKERDLALSEQDQEELGRVSPIGYERPFSASKDFGAPMAGQILPMIATSVAGRALALGVGRMALARGMTRTANIAERLGTVIEAEPMLGPRQRGLAGASEKFSEFLRVAPTAAKRGAIEGNLFGAATEANIARERGDPNWKDVGVTSYVLGAGMGAVAEVGLAGVGKLLGGTGDVVRDVLRHYPANIARAIEVAASPPDHLPLGDKMPDAQARIITNLADGLDQHLADRRAAEPTAEPELGIERRADTGALRPVWTAEERSNYITAHQKAYASKIDRTWDNWTPEEREQYFAENERMREGAPWRQGESAAETHPIGPPEAETHPAISTESFDMSQQMERLRAQEAEKAALVERERLAAEAQASGEIPPPRTPQERLDRARARYDEVTKNPAVKQIAFGAAAAVGASRAEDDDTKLALAGAAALTTGRVGSEIESVIRYRLSNGASIDALARTYRVPRSVINEIHERYNPPEPLLRDEKARLARNRAGGSGKQFRSTGPLSDIVQEHVERSRTGGGKRTPYSDRTTSASLEDVMEAANKQQGLRLLKVKNILRQLGLTEAAERVRKVGGKFILPAALAATAVNTDDPDTKAALAVAGIALTTGRIHEGAMFHSRLVQEVGKLPPSWEVPRAANDWLGKLGNATGFSKEEFNLTVKPWLEEAKAAKRKVSKAEVLDQAEKNSFELALTRRTPDEKDIVSPKPPEPPREAAVFRPRQREILDWEEVEGAEEDDGWNVLKARQDHKEAQDDAQESLDNAESHMDSERNALRGAATDAGISRRVFDQALENADNGDGGIDTDKFMEEIQDYIERETPEGYDEPTLSSASSFRVEEVDTIDPDTGDDTGDPTFRVVTGGGTLRGVGFTRLEALAQHGATYGDHNLGNLTDILGSDSRYDVQFEPEGAEPGNWAIVETRGAAQEVRMENADRNALVEEWVSDNYDGSEIEPEQENDHSERLSSYAQDYDSASRSYYETESETYSIREGDDEVEFNEALDEARAEDEAEAEAAAETRREEAAAAAHAPILREPEFDEEFYQLPESDQEYVREGIRRGAIGTRAPWFDAEGDVFTDTERVQQGTRDYIFDPAIPHTPFPREKTPFFADMNQGEMFGEHRVFTLPARTPKILKAMGESKFHDSQRTPGGSNYREITIAWGNPPGTVIPENERLTIRKVPEHRPGAGQHQVVNADGNPVSGQTHYYHTDAVEELDRHHAAIMQRMGGVPPVNFTADHYAGDPPNVQVWGRMDEHTYRGGGALHPEVKAILDERTLAAKELAAIAAEFEVLPGAEAVTPTNATPEMMAIARRYKAIQDRVNELDERYNSAVQAGYGPGTYGELATNIIEAQSDLKQKGESGGYYTPKRPSPQDETALAAERGAIATQRSAAEDEYNSFDWTSTESGRRLSTIRDLSYDRELTAAERTELNGLRSEEAAAGTLRDRVYNDAMEDATHREEAITFAAEGKALLPGEKERLAKNLAKAEERLRVAKAANDAEYTTENERELQDATSRVRRLKREEPVPDTPFKDTHAVYGLVAITALKEAAYADTDLLTWSHSTNRTEWANLPSRAAQITYDDALVSTVRKALKSIGFDVKPEVIEMDGSKHWMVRLTPAMKEAIRKATFPMLGALGLLAAPSEAKAQDGSADDGKPSVIPFLIAAGLAAGAWKTLPRAMRARLAARAKAAGFHGKESRGGVTLHANPIPEAMRALKRAPTAAAVTAIATLAANSDNPDINDTAPWIYGLAALNAIGSKNLGKGGKSFGKMIVKQLRKTDMGTAAVRFTNPAALIHPDAQAAILAFEALKTKGMARKLEYTSKLEALGPLGDRIVSDFIEGEEFENPIDVRALKPDDLHAIVLVAQDAAEEVERGTKMQVASGALHPESAIPHYLPGKYAYWEALDALTERAPRGKGPSQKNIRITPTKRRTIPREEIEARNKLGEIRESSYRVGVAIEKAYSNSAAATLFKTLRATPDVIHPEYQAALDDFLTAKELMRVAKKQNNAADILTAQGMLDAADLKRKNISTKFKLKGGDYVTMPETKSMGVLSGMVVQRDIANELNGLPERRTTDRLMRFWKQAKTVFNPGTHVANVVSNTTLAHMGGMRMTEQPIWLAKAGRDMHGYGRGARALAESGQANLNVVTAGSGGTTLRSARSEEGLAQLMQTTRPETARVLREVGIKDPKAELTPTFKKAMQATRNLYNDEDNIFRVAMYLKATAPKELKLTFSDANGMGLSHEAALKHVLETFGNFRTRSPMLRLIRGSLAPFILYPAKVLPMFAKNVVDHPLRYLTLVSMWGALNEYSKSEVGAIPDEDVDETDRRSSGYFFPGLTQLPFTNKEGDKAATSLARWTPMSGLTDVSQPGVSSSAISPNWPKSLTPSGPLTDIYAKFVNNIDTYQRKPIYSAERPLKRNLIRALEDVIQVVGPTAAGFHRERIMADIENEDWAAAKVDMLALAGMRPRYIRPGAQQQRAGYTSQDAKTDAKRELRRGLDRSKSAERDSDALKQFDEYMDQINKNYERRAFPPPRR